MRMRQHRDQQLDRPMFAGAQDGAQLGVEQWPVNLFELKNSDGSTIFHVQEYDEDFLEWCLEQWPTNIFELKDRDGHTIFHKYQYSGRFVKWCLQKWPTNLFELKNDYKFARSYTIFHTERD
jgi:hypothetical protein